MPGTPVRALASQLTGRRRGLAGCSSRSAELCCWPAPSGVTDERYHMELSNGALTHSPTTAEWRTDPTVTLTKPQLLAPFAAGNTSASPSTARPRCSAGCWRYRMNPFGLHHRHPCPKKDPSSARMPARYLYRVSWPLPSPEPPRRTLIGPCIRLAGTRPGSMGRSPPKSPIVTSRPLASRRSVRCDRQRA